MLIEKKLFENEIWEITVGVAHQRGIPMLSPGQS
jgi:hypothetical protein